VTQSSGLGSGGFAPALKRTTTFLPGREASFLASEHIAVKRIGATYDSTAITADANGDKVLKAGTVVAKVTATGKYVPYASAGTGGAGTAVGFVMESLNLRKGDVVAGLMLHGSVLEARCTGVDAGAKTALAGRIWFQ
jgi:hypothetical protein